jgi:hypothetical protein
MAVRRAVAGTNSTREGAQVANPASESTPSTAVRKHRAAGPVRMARTVLRLR